MKNYVYDSAGNKSAFAVKVGNDTKLSLKYAYDGESKLTAVSDEKGSEVAGYAYDTDGNLAKRTVQGNVMTTTYTYDYQNRLTAMKNQTGSGVISEYKSEYLLNGQKSKEGSDVTDKDGKKASKTATYTYDLLGRITKETKTGSEDISYIYDSNNNRKEMKAGNKVTAYKYNKNDELLRTDTLNTDTEEDSVVIYKNDRNGNQLATVNCYEIPSAKKDDTYIDIDVTLGDNRLNENVVNHYNAQNQLTQTLTKNYKVSFTYDAEGLRTGKTVNGEKTVFVWDGDQLVMELSESGKVQKRYVRGNDLVYADKGDNTEKQYYVTDSHGNVVQLTDQSGKVIKTYEYDTFGNEVKPDGKDENPFRYCGEFYDKETGEIYLRVRYYQPTVGRFLTRDTYTGKEDEPLSLHLYTYCDNDGVNQVDPSGHDSYIFYDKRAIAGDRIHKFSDEAKIVKKKLRKKYRTKTKIFAISTAKQFKKKWKKEIGKKKKKVNEVYLIFHGTIEGEKGKATGYMYCRDKSKIIARKTSFYDRSKDILVSELAKKKIGKLTFSCCNTANPDCYNVANAFIKRMKVKTVIGFDGGALFDYSDNRLKKGTGVQHTWNKYVTYRDFFAGYIGIIPVPYYTYEPVRERMGIRTYKNGRWSEIKMRTNNMMA